MRLPCHSVLLPAIILTGSFSFWRSVILIWSIPDTDLPLYLLVIHENLSTQYSLISVILMSTYVSNAECQALPKTTNSWCPGQHRCRILILTRSPKNSQMIMVLFMSHFRYNISRKVSNTYIIDKVYQSKCFYGIVSLLSHFLALYLKRSFLINRSLLLNNSQASIPSH